MTALILKFTVVCQSQIIFASVAFVHLGNTYLLSFHTFHTLNVIEHA